MILFENDDVLALDKPPGVSMATSSKEGKSAEDAVRRLLAACGVDGRTRFRSSCTASTRERRASSSSRRRPKPTARSASRSRSAARGRRTARSSGATRCPRRGRSTSRSGATRRTAARCASRRTGSRPSRATRRCGGSRRSPISSFIPRRGARTRSASTFPRRGTRSRATTSTAAPAGGTACATARLREALTRDRAPAPSRPAHRDSGDGHRRQAPLPGDYENPASCE